MKGVESSKKNRTDGVRQDRFRICRSRREKRRRAGTLEGPKSIIGRWGLGLHSREANTCTWFARQNVMYTVPLCWGSLKLCRTSENRPGSEIRTPDSDSQAESNFNCWEAVDNYVQCRAYLLGNMRLYQVQALVGWSVYATVQRLTFKYGIYSH